MDKTLDDIWTIIVKHIDCGSDYKAVCLVDCTRLGIIKAAHPDADTKFANQLTTLIAIVERGEWLPHGFATAQEFFEHLGMFGPVADPSIGAKFIDSHDWCQGWFMYSENPNLTIPWLEEFVKKKNNPEIWVGCSRLPCVTLDYVLAHPELPWSWPHVTINSNVTMADIEAHPDLPWCLQHTTRNPNFTQEFLIKNIDEFRPVPNIVSRHSCITIDVIRACPDFPWKWEYLTANPNMTDEVIAANSDLPWVTHSRYIRPGTTKEHVFANVHFGWDFDALAKFVTLEDFQAHPELPWQIDMVLANPGLTWEFVDAHPNGFCGRAWDYANMGCIRGLTWKKIIDLDHAGVNWSWSRIIRQQL